MRAGGHGVVAGGAGSSNRTANWKRTTNKNAATRQRDRAVRLLQAALSEPALFQAAPGAGAILLALSGGADAVPSGARIASGSAGGSIS